MTLPLARHLARRALVPCLAAVTAGCEAISSPPPVYCTSIAVQGIVVEIRDARTGAPLAADAHGVVRDGAYTDSLAVFSPSARTAALERAGTYAVEVRHDGYLTWTADGVHVDRDACHVRTQQLTALMQPVS